MEAGLMSWQESPALMKPFELVHVGLVIDVTTPTNLRINAVVAAIGGEEELGQIWRNMHQASYNIHPITAHPKMITLWYDRLI